MKLTILGLIIAMQTEVILLFTTDIAKSMKLALGTYFLISSLILYIIHKIK